MIVKQGLQMCNTASMSQEEPDTCLSLPMFLDSIPSKRAALSALSPLNSKIPLFEAFITRADTCCHRQICGLHVVQVLLPTIKIYTSLHIESGTQLFGQGV